MNCKAFAPILVCQVLLAGCGAQLAAMYGIPVVDPADGASVAAETKTSFDQYTNIREVSGPTIFYDKNILGRRYRVRTWLSKPLIGQYQVIVTVPLKDWKFLEDGYSKGMALETNVFDREVGYCGQYGCTVTESVGVMIPKKLFGDALVNGFSFKLIGQRGTEEFYIENEYLIAVKNAADSAG